MEIKEGLKKAAQILDEERASPTVTYTHVAIDSSALAQVASGLQTLVNLKNDRLTRPRPISENPRKWALQSPNYALLSALTSRLPESQRSSLLQHILPRILNSPACAPDAQPGLSFLEWALV